MSLGDITGDAVERALAEFDETSRDAFLRKYGFKPARSYFLEKDGRHYDSKAIVGAAHGYLGLGVTALRGRDFVGGEATVAKVLRRLGFHVVNLSDGAAPSSTRQPTWARDELVLALELYMRRRESPYGKQSPEVRELSEFLGRLGAAMGRVSQGDYRNINGVYMKMMNFRRFEPEERAKGRVGLTHGSKDEEVVWNEFAGDPVRLTQTAAAIRAAVEQNPDELQLPLDVDLEEAEEGRVLTVVHLRRERSRKLVEARKAVAMKQHGAVRCEACDLDFGERYGARGKGFIEVHHIRPVHTLTAGEKTRLGDLALVCSNCHRMIHRSRPWLTLDELRRCITSETRGISHRAAE